MVLKIHNTLTRKKEIFKPFKENKVKLFVCGPTVYDLSHIGHARSYVFFDVVAKYLRWKGFDVMYLQNITDVDDKIIERAKKERKDSLKLARKFAKCYLEDMEKLGVDSVDTYAYCTKFVDKILSQIDCLFENEFAYKTADGIYFDISRKEDYGKLSHQNLESLKKHRIEHNPEKRNEGDFSLWKLKSDKPVWNSPWGGGRPGWHIEDTAITESFFGPQYDLHGGGIDLIFPHHEAEIAQMEAISGLKPFVKYWMHNGHLLVDGQKMSKSLGNFITIRDALEKGDAKTLRFFFLSIHYSSPINYTEKLVEAARNSVQRFWIFLSRLKTASAKVDNLKVPKIIEKAKKVFEKGMDDDFDTSTAFAALFDFINEVNSLLDEGKVSNKDGVGIRNFFEDLDSVLGFLIHEYEIPEKILKLVQQREKARKAKNWKKSDELREEIKKSGFVVEDTNKGPVVREC